jgi:hypothetical protein
VVAEAAVVVVAMAAAVLMATSMVAARVSRARLEVVVGRWAWRLQMPFWITYACTKLR